MPQTDDLAVREKSHQKVDEFSEGKVGFALREIEKDLGLENPLSLLCRSLAIFALFCSLAIFGCVIALACHELWLCSKYENDSSPMKQNSGSFFVARRERCMCGCKIGW